MSLELNAHLYSCGSLPVNCLLPDTRRTCGVSLFDEFSAKRPDVISSAWFSCQRLPETAGDFVERFQAVAMC